MSEAEACVENPKTIVSEEEQATYVSLGQHLYWRDENGASIRYEPRKLKSGWKSLLVARAGQTAKQIPMAFEPGSEMHFLLEYKRAFDVGQDWVQDVSQPGGPTRWTKQGRKGWVLNEGDGA